ncbi:ABC transporter substrate-binding protein [Candidatus Agathobaculum pullicola]|uniref:ABC transporter substrate-binding protein n=1 Tax=Candidatus Agathobaculum pullicola TaxID=2838426 RepID=UPI003F8E19E2
MKKRIFAVLAACALLMSGCAGGPTAGNNTENTGDSNDDLRELTVVLDWYPNALHAFLYQAEQAGYFAEEGLTVNIQPPAGVNDAMSMVAAGKADIGLYYQQDVIQARVEQNVPVKSIGAVVQAPLNIVLSLKDKDITEPADLVGKTIGYAGTELSEALIHSIMQKSGQDPSSVKMIDVGFDLMSSMVTGNVDATIGCLVNHEVPQMEKEGFEVNYFFPDDYGVPQYYEGVFLANDEMIENEPDVLARFLRACAKGFDDFQTDTDSVLQVLLGNQDESNFPLDPDVEKQSCQTLLPLMETADAPFLSQSEACWQENIDWMYDEGLISTKPDVSEVMATIDF